jgi:hypothetical protein
LDSQVLWHTPVIPALRKRQKHQKFKASLGYIARPCLQKKSQWKVLNQGMTGLTYTLKGSLVAIWVKIREGDQGRAERPERWYPSLDEK